MNHEFFERIVRGTSDPPSLLVDPQTYVSHSIKLILFLDLVHEISKNLFIFTFIFFFYFYVFFQFLCALNCYSILYFVIVSYILLFDFYTFFIFILYSFVFVGKNIVLYVSIWKYLIHEAMIWYQSYYIYLISILLYINLISYYI